jgi:hypothetical protein
MRYLKTPQQRALLPQQLQHDHPLRMSSRLSKSQPESADARVGE